MESLAICICLSCWQAMHRLVKERVLLLPFPSLSPLLINPCFPWTQLLHLFFSNVCLFSLADWYQKQPNIHLIAIWRPRFNISESQYKNIPWEVRQFYYIDHSLVPCVQTVCGWVGLCLPVYIAVWWKLNKIVIHWVSMYMCMCVCVCVSECLWLLLQCVCVCISL